MGVGVFRTIKEYMCTATLFFPVLNNNRVTFQGNIYLLTFLPLKVSYKLYRHRNRIAFIPYFYYFMGSCVPYMSFVHIKQVYTMIYTIVYTYFSIRRNIVSGFLFASTVSFMSLLV